MLVLLKYWSHARNIFIIKLDVIFVDFIVTVWILYFHENVEYLNNFRNKMKLNNSVQLKIMKKCVQNRKYFLWDGIGYRSFIYIA